MRLLEEILVEKLKIIRRKFILKLKLSLFNSTLNCNLVFNIPILNSKLDKNIDIYIQNIQYNNKCLNNFVAIQVLNVVYILK